MGEQEQIQGVTKEEQGQVQEQGEVKEQGMVREQDISTVLANENLLEDPDHTIFHNVAYLGSVVVHNPKDEAAIQQHMAVMNQESPAPLAVTVSVPRSSLDSVVLREAATRTRVGSFRIQRIIFFARGQANTLENSCFAFTSAQGESENTAVVQCHVFR